MSNLLKSLADEATSFEYTLNELLRELKDEFVTALIHPNTCETEIKNDLIDLPSVNYIELETRDNFLRRISALEPQIDAITPQEVSAAKDEAIQAESDFNELDQQVVSLTQELTKLSEDSLERYLTFSENLGIAKLELEEAIEMERELAEFSNTLESNWPNLDLSSTLLEHDLPPHKAINDITDVRDLLADKIAESTRILENTSATQTRTDQDLTRIQRALHEGVVPFDENNKNESEIKKSNLEKYLYDLSTIMEKLTKTNIEVVLASPLELIFIVNHGMNDPSKITINFENQSVQVNNMKPEVVSTTSSDRYGVEELLAIVVRCVTAALARGKKEN